MNSSDSYLVDDNSSDDPDFLPDRDGREPQLALCSACGQGTCICHEEEEPNEDSFLDKTFMDRLRYYCQKFADSSEENISEREQAKRDLKNPYWS